MSIDLNNWLEDVYGLIEPPGCETVFVSSPSNPNRSCTVGIIHEHRFAFYFWACYSLEAGGSPPVLITIDTHDDVGANSDVIPSDLNSLDLCDPTSVGLFAWLRLNRLNDGHILPSLYLDLFSDVFVLIKKDNDDPLLDSSSNSIQQEGRSGNVHTVHYFNEENKLLDALPHDQDSFLDIDLDYFSDPNPETDEDRGTEIQWPVERIKDFLTDSNGVIQSVLPSVVGMTIALEPTYCGGLLNSHRALDILNQELFGNTLCTNETRWI